MRTKVHLLLALFMGLYACQDKEYVFHEYQAMENSWHKKDSVQFRFTPKDSTAQAYHVYISLRNTQAYAFRNLYLIASIQFPNGKIEVDTLAYEMAYPDGRFMGRGSSIIENKLWLKEHMRFDEQGEYVFTFRHAMRKANEIEPLTELKGILDVGIQIEKITLTHDNRQQ